MKIIGIIPARFGSTRLPRKMLRLIGQKPLVQLTYEAAKRFDQFDEVVVATDHEDIKQVIQGCGGKVIMTPEDIQSGSDRVAVAAAHFPDADVIVNVQGDTPFVKAHMLASLVKPFEQDSSVTMSTVACPLNPDTDFSDPNIVKVLLDKNDDAIYFSRAAIPHNQNRVPHLPVMHHMGLYAYTPDFLKIFSTLSQTPLEQAERLEQLRVLEHGFKIRVAKTPEKVIEINVEEELEAAQLSMESSV